MAKLPTRYDISQQPSGRSGRMLAEYDTSAIGKGLASLGGSLQGLGAEIQQQRDTVDLARAEAYKTKGFIDVTNEFSEDGDYSTFNKRAPERTGTVVKTAADLIRNPALREKWKINAETDAVRTNDSIGDRGRALGRQAETVAFDDALETNRRIYVDPETPEEAKAKARADIEGAIQIGEEKGLLTPEQAAARRDQYVKNAEFSRAKLFAEKDPSAILDWSGKTPSIIDSITTVESTGNAGAESPKGASGLMQVMPETGAEIARELGDKNFPVGGTIEQQKAYLKNPTVSRQYGTHYFGKMLARYDGDTEAALIAYNGGAQRADDWLSSGRDDSVIPKESADYYKKVLANTGVSKMDISPSDVQRSKAFLQTRTDKDASHIQGLNDTFSVKLARFFDAAPPEIKAGLGIYSGARTIDRQQELWDEALKKYGSPEAARKWVAPPGKSEHNHGTAADLSYNGQSLAGAPPEVVKWVHENAPQYGLKFPLGNENWHIEDAGTRGGTRVASAAPSWWNDLSPEQRQIATNAAETRKRQISAEQQGAIENVVQNAPAAIQNTGSYSGSTPSMQQFMEAYGPQEGAQRYAKFSTALEVADQSYNFRTLSAQDIQQVVEAAVPTSSGNDAALEGARYSALQQAAATTLAARKADPSAYTMQVFPSVGRAWEDAEASGNYQPAMTAMAAAQQQLGIQNMQLLPKAVADQSVNNFKDGTLPGQDRLNAVTGLVFSTPDPTQRQAVFKQLVDAGLPQTMEGVFEAVARGDQGAATRLMEAVTVDPAKLPNSGENTPAVITENIYSNVWAPGEVGYTAYGLSYGDASSLERAQRGTELLNKAVRLRISRGEDMQTAVDGAKKDLFGDKVVFDGFSGVNADIAVDPDVDQAALNSGLNASKDVFREALATQRDRIVSGTNAPAADGQKAILDTATENRINDIVSNGVFVQTGGGIGLRDPYTGQFVAGPDGKPLTLSMEEVISLAPGWDDSQRTQPTTGRPLGGWAGRARQNRTGQ
ncbi:transglycosylase SLT domain-containing protein [Neorhizobium sp. IRAMC:178]|uniref:transglycosylase SLT domain-containing protein n=1 Tax=Neorhizobium tunisiense TaxID=3144793 RepID=UPI0031F67488